MDVGAVVHIADEKVSEAARTLRLGVAAQTEVRVARREHFGVDRAMRTMADGATLAHSRVLEDDRLGLFAMALGAGLVQTRHRQPASGFHDVLTVGIMALDAVHLAFENGVVLWKMEFRLLGQMAPKASLGIFPGVDDKFSAPPRATPQGHMFAPRAVAGFAPVLAGHLGTFRMEAGVRAGGESPGDICMAVGAGLVPHECCPFDLGGNNRRAIHGGAGVQEQRKRARACHH